MNDLWPGTRIKRLRISRASLDTYRASHSSGGRTRDSKLFVISIPNNLLSTVEQFLIEQGIEMKRKNQPRPKSDPTAVESEDDGEETDDGEDEDEE